MCGSITNFIQFEYHLRHTSAGPSSFRSGITRFPGGVIQHGERWEIRYFNGLSMGKYPINGGFHMLQWENKLYMELSIGKVIFNLNIIAKAVESFRTNKSLTLPDFFRVFHFLFHAFHSFSRSCSETPGLMGVQPVKRTQRWEKIVKLFEVLFLR